MDFIKLTSFENGIVYLKTDEIVAVCEVKDTTSVAPHVSIILKNNFCSTVKESIDVVIDMITKASRKSPAGAAG